MESVECIVVGAGVVGLAIARALAQAGREVIVLDREDAIGTHTSSRNSEVVHAGLYYPPGSLKARLCVAGKHALYAFCDSHGVAAQRCGKLIVATDDGQRAGLQALQSRAAACGVTDLRWLAAGEVRALEPELRCVAALLSPSTGIVDSHGFILALQGDAQAAGAFVVLNAPLLGARAQDTGFEVEVGGSDPMTLNARWLVNAAGLGAQGVARRIEGLPPQCVPALHLAKGNYYGYAGRAPFRHLVYPVPHGGGLGVHITLDLGGQMRFGPDVEWVDKVEYTVDPARSRGFYEAVRRYWPGLPDGSIEPGYAGIRPKLERPGGSDTDFLVQGPADHGLPGLVNLFGIESPGLTASLALAGHVAGLLGVAASAGG